MCSITSLTKYFNFIGNLLTYCSSHKSYVKFMKKAEDPILFMSSLVREDIINILDWYNTNIAIQDGSICGKCYSCIINKKYVNTYGIKIGIECVKVKIPIKSITLIIKTSQKLLNFQYYFNNSVSEKIWQDKDFYNEEQRNQIISKFWDKSGSPNDSSSIKKGNVEENIGLFMFVQKLEVIEKIHLFKYLADLINNKV